MQKYTSYKVMCLPSEDPLEVHDVTLRRVEFHIDVPNHYDSSAVYREATARAPSGFYVHSMTVLEWSPRWKLVPLPVPSFAEQVADLGPRKRR